MSINEMAATRDVRRFNLVTGPLIVRSPPVVGNRPVSPAWRRILAGL